MTRLSLFFTYLFFFSFSRIVAQTSEKSKHDIDTNNATVSIQADSVVSIYVEEVKRPVENNPDLPYLVVEEPALFNNKDFSEFINWINNNIKYPPIELDGVFGKVYVQFVVDTLGGVTDVKIIRGVDSVLDKEAIRVVKSSPIWTPARQSGKRVKQQFIVPVRFPLQ